MDDRFFSHHFYLIGADILQVVEFTRLQGCIPHALNATFVASIPKCDKPKTFTEFRLVSLCNLIYKVITKILSDKMKPLLAEVLSED